ncbi:MAG: ferrous iron transport protein B [Clostridia bacterium]|nr:ferrous iron transport protein B [Clostridia bacterium]
MKIALAGNPNCGKTTLFNTLTGSNQYVGNWPGVTVEKKEGKLKNYNDVTVVDLPGIYSLSSYSLEEVVARNFLTEESPNVILNVIDATNLERNLYLTTQLTELGIPVVIALNMTDVVRKRGDKIDVETLSKRIGCKIIEISALKGDGIEEIVSLAVAEGKNGRSVPKHLFSGEVEHTLAHIEEAVLHDYPEVEQRYLAIKIFERDEKILQKLNIDSKKLSHIEEDIVKAEQSFDDDAESIIICERYDYVARILNGVYVKKRVGLSPSTKIDKIVTNRYLALPIFFAIMFIVYYVSVTTVGGYFTDFTTGLFGEEFEIFGVVAPGLTVVLKNALTLINCAPWLQSLILDGIVAGVGSVLSFVPQILVLFLFLAFLEDCGYMSRIAFVLDKIFRKFGLSGKSFIPMLIGTGCSVPGIMASRTIENARDRKMTITVTTFIPCGAKLPFIALIAGAVFGGAWWVAPFAYFIGMVAVVVSGLILKKFKAFSAVDAPFVMELPDYHMPLLKNVLKSTWERGWSFIKKAGTVILLSSIVIWFLTYFGFINGTFRMLLSSELENSLLAYLGKAVAWIFAPLGFGNWQSAVATVTGLVAKENIVSTLEILFINNGGIQSAFTNASGIAYLIFNLLCAPCFAAMGAISREMQSAKWTAFALIYQTVFAYVTAFIAYNFVMLITGAITGIAWLTFAISILVLIGVIFMILRPEIKARTV